MIRRLLAGPTFASFRRPGYPFLWLCLTMYGLANSISQVVIGWLALEFTGSALAVGVAIAVRMLPRLLLGVPIGALSDHYDRRRIMQLTNLAGAAAALLAAGATWLGRFDFVGVVAVAAAVGTLDVALTTTSKALVYDLVGPEEAVNGIALETLADKLFGVFGALLAGVLLARVSGTAAFGAMSVAYLLGALSLVGVHQTRASASANDEGAVGVIGHGWSVLWHNAKVRLLAAIAISAEVLAFSSDVLLPVFARDILAVGEEGLGQMGAIRHFGGVVGLLVIATIAKRVPQGRLLLGLVVVFGLGLVAFSVVTEYSVALGVLLVIGVAWAGVDSMLPALLQYGVADEERGAAVGAWNLSRGFGPVGNIGIGALAGVIGAPMAQALGGGSLIVVVLLLAARVQLQAFEPHPLEPQAPTRGDLE